MQLIEERDNRKRNEEKIQIQIKDNISSKSFTIVGMDITYAYEIIFETMKKIVDSPLDEIRIICYKPPKNAARII